MNKAETSELLSYCAAFDQRTIGQADVEAWSRALADIPWDDTTRDAVAAHYSVSPTSGEDEMGRRFIQPHQVRNARKKIRQDRIERLPLPCPNTVEGVLEHDEMRAMVKAIGDGVYTTWAQLAAYEVWGGSLHLAQQTGDFPVLEGPEPVNRGAILAGPERTGGQPTALGTVIRRVPRAE